MPARRQSDNPKTSLNPANLSPATLNPSDDAAESTPELRLLGELRPMTTREERIAMNAYWRAASRQFAPGHELDDWLAAEAEIDARADTSDRK